MSNDAILDTKRIGEISSEKFLVPSYQRGYRWSEQQVRLLLDDILDFLKPDNKDCDNTNPDKFYCLQPIVLNKNNDDTYEVIDGQQRLTTIYIIDKYIKSIEKDNSPTFSIFYENPARNNTASLLAKITELEKDDSNIDAFCISKAYETIKKWFEKKPIKKINILKKIFRKRVLFIWYELESSETPIDIFIRLNIGKIPLTSSELVRGMFLSKNNKEITEKEQLEISLQWDNIERELHNNSFWYFLTNNNYEKYPTRIDLILDLISEKKENAEEYYTFFYFNNQIKERKKSVIEIWKEIERSFLNLRDWYKEHILYHKIGYLISSLEDQINLQTIFNLYKNATKKDFERKLDEKITECIKPKDNETYQDWEYGKYNKKIYNLLLLFNVISVMNIESGSERFPFEKFKSNDQGSSWSLEHIDPQHHSDEVNMDKEDWKNWIKEHIDLVKEEFSEEGDDMEKLLKEMEEIINKTNNGKIDINKCKKIRKDIISIIEKKENVSSRNDLHGLSNLALLKSDHNAALSNSLFNVKRKKVIEMDKKGEYIPICTRRVFLKYYSSDAKTLYCWTKEDRNKYIEEMNKVLEKYLQEKI